MNNCSQSRMLLNGLVHSIIQRMHIVHVSSRMEHQVTSIRNIRNLLKFNFQSGQSRTKLTLCALQGHQIFHPNSHRYICPTGISHSGHFQSWTFPTFHFSGSGHSVVGPAWNRLSLNLITETSAHHVVNRTWCIC